MSRQFQFSLRAFLVAVTLFSVGLGAMVVAEPLARRNNALGIAVEVLGWIACVSAVLVGAAAKFDVVHRYLDQEGPTANWRNGCASCGKPVHFFKIHFLPDWAPSHCSLCGATLRKRYPRWYRWYIGGLLVFMWLMGKLFGSLFFYLLIPVFLAFDLALWRAFLEVEAIPSAKPPSPPVDNGAMLTDRQNV